MRLDLPPRLEDELTHHPRSDFWIFHPKRGWSERAVFTVNSPPISHADIRPRDTRSIPKIGTLRIEAISQVNSGGLPARLKLYSRYIPLEIRRNVREKACTKQYGNREVTKHAGSQIRERLKARILLRTASYPPNPNLEHRRYRDVKNRIRGYIGVSRVKSGDSGVRSDDSTKRAETVEFDAASTPVSRIHDYDNPTSRRFFLHMARFATRNPQYMPEFTREKPPTVISTLPAVRYRPYLPN
jgi:hypothetical protein